MAILPLKLLNVTSLEAWRPLDVTLERLLYCGGQCRPAGASNLRYIRARLVVSKPSKRWLLLKYLSLILLLIPTWR